MDNQDKDKLIAELREREDRYRSLTQTSIDAILTTNQHDLFLTWNRSAEIIFGHGQEIVGRPVTIIIPEEYRKAHVEGMKRFLRTGEKHLIGRKAELQALHRDGTEFPIELSLSTWNSSSHVYFGAIIRDITERKNIDRIREDVHRMLRHDLRSPLIGIIGLANVVLNEKGLTEKQREAGTLIQQLGQKTLSLLDRSRDLFQMEMGTFDLETRPFNLNPLLTRVLKEIEPLLLKKNITIRVLKDGEPVEQDFVHILRGDEGLLEMMFSNLIKNAVEASPENSEVKITMSLQGKKGMDYHVFDIHNQGTVPKEIRGSFFEPYATSGKKGGTGLGTYNARLIAGTHRGDIRYSSSDEEGTHLIISLPA